MPEAFTSPVLALWLVYGLLAVIAVVDWRERRIANNSLLLLFTAAIIYAIWRDGTTPSSWGISLLVGLALTLPAYLNSRLGGGDVKLMVAICPIWQAQELLFIFASGVLAVALTMKATTRAQARRLGLPLGTAIAVGATLLLLVQHWLPEQDWVKRLGLYHQRIYN